MASGDRLALFTPKELEPLSANTAAFALRNQHPVLEFDDTTQEHIVFFDVMPDNYGGGGLTVTIGWSAADTTVGPNDVRWDVAFERLADDAQDMDSDGFAAANSVTDTEASASGELSYADITFTDGVDMDSIVAGDAFRIKISRDPSHADDDLTGDAQIRFVKIEET